MASHSVDPLGQGIWNFSLDSDIQYHTDGNLNNIRIPFATLDPPQSCTFMVQFKAHKGQTSNWGRILCFFDGSYEIVHFSVKPDHTIHVKVANDSAQLTGPMAKADTGRKQWLTLVTDVQESKFRFYLDGNLIASEDIPSGYKHPSNVAMNTSGTENMAGQVYAFRFWKGALNPIQKVISDHAITSA